MPKVANALDTDGYLRSGARPRDENGETMLLPIGYRRIRRLTPKECERLQGFPDEWTLWGMTVEGKLVIISDTQRYRMCGNAVTVNVVELLAHRLMWSIRYT
jgi:site-specific DNA-cytosine methylase